MKLEVLKANHKVATQGWKGS